MACRVSGIINNDWNKALQNLQHKVSAVCGSFTVVLMRTVTFSCTPIQNFYLSSMQNARTMGLIFTVACSATIFRSKIIIASYTKPFWNFWMREKLQLISFKSILTDHEITDDPVYEKSPLPPSLLPFWKSREGNASVLRRPWMNFLAFLNKK